MTIMFLLCLLITADHRMIMLRLQVLIRFLLEDAGIMLHLVWDMVITLFGGFSG